jgi:hypothetical protein
VHINIRPLQNSSHISQTTNTLAFALSYTHEGIHKHLLFYKAHVANACRPWIDVHAPEGVLVVALEVENFGQKVKYDAEGNAEDQAGSQRGSRITDKFDHLFKGHT